VWERVVFMGLHSGAAVERRHDLPGHRPDARGPESSTPTRQDRLAA